MPEGSEGRVISLDVYNNGAHPNRRIWDGKGFAIVTIEFDDDDPSGVPHQWSVPADNLERIPPRNDPPPYDPERKFVQRR